jgi:hypothetical protein
LPSIVIYSNTTISIHHSNNLNPEPKKSFSIVDRIASLQRGAGRTYDWLEGRHVCPNSRGVTRQFVEMVAGILYLRKWWRSGGRFVVEILGVPLFREQHIELWCCLSASLIRASSGARAHKP